MKEPQLKAGFIRVRHVPSGRVFLRHTSTAKEMQSAHPAEFQIEHDPNARSIPELLNTMTDVRGFARANGIIAPAEADRHHVINQLVPLIEAGTITLPQEIV